METNIPKKQRQKESEIAEQLILKLELGTKDYLPNLNDKEKTHLEKNFETF